jgi:hypothetical protein
VKRNIERFPDDFCFRLSSEDISNLKSQNATSSWGGRRNLPNAFTEQGVAMLSTVIKSDTAVKVSIQIMNAFVAMRRFLSTNAQVFQRLEFARMNIPFKLGIDIGYKNFTEHGKNTKHILVLGYALDCRTHHI